MAMLMHIHVSPKPKSDMLVLGIFDDKKLERDAAAADGELKGAIAALLKDEFKPDFRQTKFMHVGKGIKNILLIGLGKRTEFDTDKLRKASAIAAKAARANRIKSFAMTLHHSDAKGSYIDKGRAIAEGVILGLYRFAKYKTSNEEFKVEEIALIESDKKRIEELGHGVHIGSVLANATNYVRDIVNSPACFVTPTALAGEAQDIAKKHKLKIKVFNKRDIERLGMNALLGVAKGSAQDPKFIILEYKTKAKDTIAVVGKGITFDSGGLDLKPPAYMDNMKQDKAGAAAVLGIMQTVAHLKLPVNVIGVISAAENMPGPAAQKPGDIVTAYNKKTIEIINTDAEGRLVLCDAISYIEKNYKTQAIVDLATLTGACIVALGYHAAGVMGNNEELIKKVKDAGWRSFERVWQLPLWQEHKEAAKSEIADVANATKPGVFDAGTINGAAFLSYFVEKTPWVHIDIAGTAWVPAELEYIPKNATGYGVRLVTQLLMDWKK